MITTPSIPDAMTGGWVRNGISLGGAAPVENAVVWWLQAPSRHCDLRVPLPGETGAMCFAGTTSWRAPSLTWTPELELEPSVYADTGVITWDGADLIETGVSRGPDGEVGYVERWQRLPGSEAELLALSSPTGRLVRTGPYALTLLDNRAAGGQFAAVAWILEDSAWLAQHAWPPGAAAPPPPLDVGTDDLKVQLDDGSVWTVEENRKGW